MRCFVAAELPDELWLALSETSAALRASVSGRYVAPDSLHVTLAFLGEVDAHAIAETECVLAEVASSAVPITCTLASLGTFGRGRRRLLWQGFGRGADELSSLAARVRAGLTERGIAFDGTSFLPHVTLMRAADLSRGSLPMPQVATGDVARVTLFSSDLSGPRPRYEPLSSFELVGRSPDA